MIDTERAGEIAATLAADGYHLAIAEAGDRVRVTITAVLVAAIAVGSADAASFVLLKRYFSQRAAASVRDVAGAAAAATGAG